MESFSDISLGIAVHWPYQVLLPSQKICGFGGESSQAKEAICELLPSCTVHCLFSACRNWKPHRQSRQGRCTLQYRAFRASTRGLSIRWIRSSGSCYGSFLSCQKGTYTCMGMHDGHISVWLVGSEKRCDCIAIPFHSVSDVRIYRHIAASNHEIGTWAYGPFRPFSMALPLSRSSESLKGLSSGFYRYILNYSNCLGYY